MPFDGSGNFSRVHNWVQDRDDGIHILASRMDEEFDNFAAGMNVVFFRNGLVPLSGNLNMGTNYILGLGAGSVGALSMRFADDPNSGIFLDGFNKPSLVAGGTKRLEANTAGVAVTGTLDSSGALRQGGNQVWHAGNLVNPASLNGAAFVGNVSVPQITVGDSNFVAAVSGGNPFIGFDSNDFVNYDRTGNQYNFVIGGNTRYVVNNSGAAVTGTFNSTGALTQNGQQVWHAGNLNPAIYAPLAGATFTGNVGIGIAPNRPLEVMQGGGASIRNSRGSNASDVIQEWASGGAVQYWLGSPAWQDDGRSFGLFNAIAGVWTYYATAANVLNVPANTNHTGSLQVSGNNVWHSGNLTPGNYATLAGANNFTNLQRFSAGTDEKIRLYGTTQPFISVYDATQTTRWGYLGLTATTAQLSADNAAGSIQLLVGGATRGQITNAVANFQGTLQQAGSAVWHAGNLTPSNYALLSGAAFTGNISTTGSAAFGDSNFLAAISGGNPFFGFDSDDFINYDRTGNQYNHAIAGTTRFSVNSAGAIVNGDLTKSGAGAYLSRGAGSLSAVVTQGTAAPSGGSDGDIYLQYS